MATFQQYSKYYDLLYKDKIIRRKPCDKKIVVAKGCQILELGSIGSHARYFYEAGFRVTGIEKKCEMVDLAKSKALLDLT
jgi:hypothetical protein